MRTVNGGGLVLTSVAVEAAEPLVQVLLVLQAGPVSSQQGLVPVLVAAGPLSGRRVCRVTHEQRRRHRHQHLNLQGTKETKALHYCVVSTARTGRTVYRAAHSHPLGRGQ